MAHIYGHDVVHKMKWSYNALALIGYKQSALIGTYCTYRIPSPTLDTCNGIEFEIQYIQSSLHKLILLLLILFVCFTEYCALLVSMGYGPLCTQTGHITPYQVFGSVSFPKALSHKDHLSSTAYSGLEMTLVVQSFQKFTSQISSLIISTAKVDCFNKC